MQVIKRDGRKVEFDKDKIKGAVLKAFDEVYSNANKDNISDANYVCKEVCNSIDYFLRIKRFFSTVFFNYLHNITPYPFFSQTLTFV